MEEETHLLHGNILQRGYKRHVDSICIRTGVIVITLTTILIFTYPLWGM